MMYKLILSILFVVISIAVYAQSRAIYVNPAFYSLAKDHKKVAVIPFNVQVGLRPKEREAMTDDQLRDMEEKQGVAAQNALVSWFLKQQNTQGYTVQFQDVNTTNALLLKAGMNIHDLATYTPDEIAKTLGVDAVMGGMIQTTKPISDGASVAMGVLLGYYGATNTGNITINLNDSDSGDLLWKYDKELSRSLGSNMNQIMDTLMRKASRKFPYGDMDALREAERKS
ncbi:MAG: hypothetical protein M3R25_07825 [Bacteroidota bacterium]|nr:hypothetical protein [Bacteroidota bacterium]